MRGYKGYNTWKDGLNIYIKYDLEEVNVRYRRKYRNSIICKIKNTKII